MYKRQAAWVVGILCVAVLAAPGCVSKKAYESGMEDLDGRVVAVESAVEANQKRVNDLSKDTDQKVSALKADNQKSMQVGQQAMTKATAAERARCVEVLRVESRHRRDRMNQPWIADVLHQVAADLERP